jgi:hypothetical protein
MLHAMLTALSHLDLGALFAALPGPLAGPPPIDPTGPIKDLTAWVIKILGVVAVLFFVIDLFRHITASPRDLRSIGVDVFTMAIVIGVAAKAEALVQWATTLFA